MTISVPTSGFRYSKWIVDATPGLGTHTTIQAAIDAASSGDTIFVRGGTYTENLTLKAGINIESFATSVIVGGTIINGKCSFSSAGNVSFDGITFQTNSDYCIEITGTAASHIYLTDCFIYCLNHTGINNINSAGNSSINLYDCAGDIATTGITLYTNTLTNILRLFNCSFENTGNSTTPSTGDVSIDISSIDFQVSVSGTNTFYVTRSRFNSFDIGVPSLVTAGTGISTIVFSAIQSGTAACIEVGSGTELFSSSMTFGSQQASGYNITGSGSVYYRYFTYVSTATSLDPSLTLILLGGTPDFETPISAALGGTGISSPTAHQLIVGSSASACSEITAGLTGEVLIGSTGADPLFSANPSVTSITLNGGTALGAYLEQQAWTPVITGAGTAGTGTYTTQSGYYTRIGNMIFAQIVIVWTAHTGTGDMTITGFPFPVRNSSNYDPEATVATSSVTLPVGSTWIEGHILANTSTLLLYGGATAAAASPVQMQASGTIHAAISYLT